MWLKFGLDEAKHLVPVSEALTKGKSLRAIARESGIAINTIRKVARCIADGEQ